MNADIVAEYDRLQRLSGMDIFDRRGGRGEPGGFKFVCPGVAFSADDVHIEIRDRKWHLSYDDNGRTYTGVAEDMVGAYLTLIADRYGLTAVVTSKPDPDEEASKP